MTFVVAVCNQFALFLLIYITEECADFAVFANWQICESQDHVFSLMSDVAPMQANQNPIIAELCFSCCQDPSATNHVRVCTVQALLAYCQSLILL